MNSFSFNSVVRAMRAGVPQPNFGAPVPPGGGSTTFDALYPQGHQLVTGTALNAKASQARPASKATDLVTPSYTDQVYGTKVFRATAVGDIPNATPWYNRHEYSRRQAFNCDNTRFITQALSGHWYLYNATTMARLPGGRTAAGAGNDALGLPDNSWWFTGDCEPIWHPTDPSKIWVTGQNGAGGIWYEFDTVNKTRTVLFNIMNKMAGIGFTGATFIGFMGEGRPSDDGEWWGMGVQDSTSEFIGFLKYRRSTDTVVWSVATTNKPNNVSTSRSGSHVVVGWANGNELDLNACRAASVHATNGTRAYSDATNFVQINYYNEHGDEALNEAGEDIYVSICINSVKMNDEVGGGFLYARRLSDGQVTQFFRGDQGNSGAWHFSGHASRARPGWVLCSKYVGTTVNIWNDLEIMAVRVKNGSYDLRRIAQHQSTYSSAQGDAYWTEPHATINADGTRIMFTSNFGNTAGPCEDYMLGLASWHLN